MRALYPFFALTIIFSLLSACQTTEYNYATPYDSPYSVPPPGTLLTLNQSIPFSPDNSRSNIQNGVALGRGGYDRFQPWCQFYLNESSEAMKASRAIEPDQFTVVRAGQKVDRVLAKKVDVAAVGFGVGGSVYFPRPFDDEIGAETLTTVMWLRSDNQPQVQELRCSVTDDPRPYNFITINQIIQTLGDVVTLKLPGATQ